jgi:hypothetical protein
MDPALLTAVREEIKTTVNGKIDRINEKLDIHNQRHEKDMNRMMPIIESYEATERRLEDARASGAFIMKVVGVFIAIGSAWLLAKQLWPWI